MKQYQPHTSIPLEESVSTFRIWIVFWKFTVCDGAENTRCSYVTHQYVEADSDLVCQPGAGWVDINEMLKKKGARNKQFVLEIIAKDVLRTRNTAFLPCMLQFNINLEVLYLSID